MCPSIIENYRNPLGTYFQNSNLGFRFEQYTDGKFIVVTGTTSQYAVFIYRSTDNPILVNTWYHIVLC